MDGIMDKEHHLCMSKEEHKYFMVPVNREDLVMFICSGCGITKIIPIVVKETIDKYLEFKKKNVGS